MPDCLKDAAREVPHLPALALPGKTLSFAELDSQAEMQAKELRELGIGPGDRIAVCHWAKERLIPLLFATWRVGASICPLNTRLPPLQIESALLRLRPKLFVDEMRLFHSEPNAMEPSLFLFTSGSTGTPKIAILSQENLVKSALYSLDKLQFQPKDRWLLSLPLYHVGGMGIIFRTILGRGTMVLDEGDRGITHLSNVPTQLYRAWPLYPRLKCLLIGGGPMGRIPEQLPIFVSYGLTEMASLVTLNAQVLPGREVRIAEDGEIWVRGECRFQGYWGEATPFDEEGWFPTGDLGKLNGGLTILGRKDWMFISGGENIQPEEIEQCLLRIPGVLEAVVIPIPDPEFGKRPIAAIRSLECSAETLRKALLNQLPKYKIPIAFHFFEELPKNGLKIDRKKTFELITESK